MVTSEKEKHYACFLIANTLGWYFYSSKIVLISVKKVTLTLSRTLSGFLPVVLFTTLMSALFKIIIIPCLVILSECSYIHFFLVLTHLFLCFRYICQFQSEESFKKLFLKALLLYISFLKFIFLFTKRALLPRTIWVLRGVCLLTTDWNWYDRNSKFSFELSLFWGKFFSFASSKKLFR